jgi:hypothetical protein
VFSVIGEADWTGAAAQAWLAPVLDATSDVVGIPARPRA